MPSSPPPYAPGFGVVPPVPVGRGALLSEHERGLLHDPGDPHYTWALIGERGVGKTVYLTMLGERMRDRGWAVLDYQAIADHDPLRDLLKILPDALGCHSRGRGWRSLQRELTVEPGAAVIKLQGRLTTPAPGSGEGGSDRLALERALRHVGDYATKQHVGLLITIDEAQTLGQNLKPLGAVMQMVTSRQRQPIAFALAGTPELGQLLQRSDSFPERMPRAELEMLTDEQSRLALLEPANARQVTWDETSARLIADAAAGYPYFVQLGGYEAWHAEPSEHMIGQDAGARAVRAIKAAADRIFRDRWDRLGPVQRAYLASAAVIALEDHPAGISTGQVARALGKQQTELSMIRRALIEEHHLLRAGARGYLLFAFPRFQLWLQEQLVSPQPAEGFEGLLATSLAPPGPKARHEAAGLASPRRRVW
ncbi:MAG: ATP-binding protein [Solirubrobacteraceae bacterium]